MNTFILTFIIVKTKKINPETINRSSSISKIVYLFKKSKFCLNHLYLNIKDTIIGTIIISKTNNPYHTIKYN